MERRNKGSAGSSEAVNTEQGTDVTSFSRRGDKYSALSDRRSSNPRCPYGTPLPDGFGVNKNTRNYRYKRCRDDQPYKRKLSFTKHENDNAYSRSNSHELIHKTGTLCSESSSDERKHKTDNSCSESSSQFTSYACSTNSVSNSFISIENETDVDVDETDSIIPVKPSYKRTKSQYSVNNHLCVSSVENQPFFLNTFPPSKKRNNIIEDSGDLEIDTIIPQDVCDKFLQNPPNSLPMDYTDMNPSKQPLPRQQSILEFLGLRPDKEPCQKSNIYIPHKYADEPQGDTLGVQIWTYVIKQKDGTIYNQHFFVCVVTDGPADKMKIRDNDEIVLVNGTFVPQITHTDLLNLFHNVKVDGKTRLEIIVRRTAKANRGFKKEWEWIQTSAVLAPDMRKELDNFPVVEYGKVSSHVGDGDELKPCMKEYQVSGTQYFLDIRNGEVCVNIKFRTTADRTKRICKRARVKVCPKDPTIVHYFAALSNEHRTEYISLGHKDEIKLDDKPLWFEFKKSSDEIWFKTKELFLSCNRSTAKLMADHKKFLFKESSADEEGFDCPDGSSQMNAASSYFGTSSCCANTLTHGNNFFGVSGADVESTCCDMSELPSAEEVNGLENESKVNKPEQCPIKEPKRSEMTLNINGNMNSSSSPHEILKTPTTPFASLLIAN